MEKLTLSHLRTLEAESIHIIREVAAEFSKPVMLYSIGKDSSCMVRLAQKAFYPGKIPFPLLHVDTTYKFREMIEFRDRFCKEIGVTLIVHTNQEGLANNINPFDHGSARYTDIMKTQSLRQALDAGKYDAAIRGARRDGHHRSARGVASLSTGHVIMRIVLLARRSAHRFITLATAWAVAGATQPTDTPPGAPSMAPQRRATPNPRRKPSFP